MNKNVFLVLVLTLGLFATACNKDHEKPVIKLIELGQGDAHGNDHTATVGGELHIEAEIEAEGKIQTVNVKIHPEGGHAKNTEWELDTTYTKFSGLKNTTFHEHVDIDSTAEAGDYHFDFIVTDEEGNQSSVEAELKIIE